jgi:hypothetical protein
MKDNTVRIITSVELAATIVSLRSDGIIHLGIKDDVEVNVEDIREMNKAVEKIGGGRKFANLVTVGKYTTVSKEARDFAATDEANQYTLADAYVLHSFHQKIIANFFIKFNKPKLPVKFFDSEEEALEWLRQFVL